MAAVEWRIYSSAAPPNASCAADPARSWWSGSANMILSKPLKPQPKRKENSMATELKKNDPQKAREFFANKLAFTTGPVELHYNLHQRAPIAVIDVCEEEDY